MTVLGLRRNIDSDLLRQQRLTLLQVIDTSEHTHAVKEDLDGIVNLLDWLQDQVDDVEEVPHASS